MSCITVKPSPPSVMSAATISNTQALPLKSVSDAYGAAFEPSISKPALQNADTDVNIACQIPILPFFVQKNGSKSSVPVSSIAPVIIAILRTSLTMPFIRSCPSASCKVTRSLRVMRLRIIMNTSVANVITPSPPICIRISIITCPNAEKSTVVERTTNPVTHTALADVNIASLKFSHSPSVLETGRARKNAPTNMTARKPNNTISMGRMRSCFFILGRSPLICLHTP